MTLARINMTGDTAMFSPLRDAASDAAAAASAAAAEAAKNAWLPAAGATGYDPDIVGHAQNKGWDKMPAPQAAFEAAKAHRASERLIGVPAERIVTLPKEATDEAGWQNVWTKLGAPKEAKEYDFTTVKFTDGKDLDAAFVDTIRAAAFKNHLPAAAAQDFARSIVKLVEDGDKADAAVTQEQTRAEQEKLVKASGLDWTLVQPVGLTDLPATGRWLASAAGDIRAQMVSRDDLAAFIASELCEPRHVRETVAFSG